MSKDVKEVVCGADEARRLLDEATPGPWYRVGDDEIASQATEVYPDPDGPDDCDPHLYVDVGGYDPRRSIDLLLAAPALARAVIAQAEEIAALRAIIEGRTTPPTEAEIMAHDRAGGAWLHADAGGIYADTTGDDVRSCVVETVPQGPARRWIALDRDGRPCAWPAIHEGDSR